MTPELLAALAALAWKTPEEIAVEMPAAGGTERTRVRWQCGWTRRARGRVSSATAPIAIDGKKHDLPDGVAEFVYTVDKGALSGAVQGTALRRAGG